MTADTAWRTSGDGTAITDETIERIDRWWRAANYLSVGQIYLLDNPLLRRPLERDDIKPRLLGHWGTTPGLNFVYAHMNRVIQQRDLNVVNITGPGHGGPGMVANAYLEGTYEEVYSSITRDEDGMRRLFRQFSFPGGIPSHASAELPGSINEGGELGYSLSHAYGAAFDNPDLLVCAVVGDGEAETGPLATSWHSNKFVDPLHDGVVLPILHLNGYKIANPTLLARLPEDELLALMRGYGHTPYVMTGGFDGEDHEAVHRRMAETLDAALDHIARIKKSAADGTLEGRPAWPMIILRTPKGWTCPPEVDEQRIEGSWRAHQVPLSDVREDEGHLRMLEDWMRSYAPQELFDDRGSPSGAVLELSPQGPRRMSDNPHANGGLVRKDLRLPDFRDFAVEVADDDRGTRLTEPTRRIGEWLTEVVRANPENFRIFAPDELASNRLAPPVFDATAKQWNALYEDDDSNMARRGRAMEMLSEHQCQG